MADEMIGKRFGMLVVVERVENYFSPGKANRRRYKCNCDCGGHKVATGQLLRNGSRTNCGCVAREKYRQRATTHGMTDTVEFKAWVSMKSRCFDAKCDSYKHYGARGITVHEGWIDNFAAFYQHIGKRPSAGHSLDRINPNGNYEPGNVRWATKLQQEYNKRKTKRLVLDNGVSLDTQQIQILTGLPKHEIYKRLKRGQQLLPYNPFEMLKQDGHEDLIVMPFEVFLALARAKHQTKEPTKGLLENLQSF